MLWGRKVIAGLPPGRALAGAPVPDRAGMAAGASTAGPQHLPLAKVWKTEVEVRMGAQRVRGPPRPGVEVRKLPSLHCAGWRRNK